MRAEVVKRASALLDLEALAVDLGRSNPVVARRFLAAAEKTFALLASLPRMGAPFALTSPRLQGLRRHPVRRFPNYATFYLPLADGIEVVRVLHGARDLAGLLGGS